MNHKTSKFKSYLVHKTNDSVYGCLFVTDIGLMFRQDFQIEINKDKKIPKIISDDSYKYKYVDDSILNSFEEIDEESYLNLWAKDFNKI